MLTLRKDVGSGRSHYHYKNPHGTEFSIIDIGTLMSTVPNFQEIKNSGAFVGWEGMEIDEGGGLIHDFQYRHETWKQLQEILDGIR